MVGDLSQAHSWRQGRRPGTQPRAEGRSPPRARQHGPRKQQADTQDASLHSGTRAASTAFTLIKTAQGRSALEEAWWKCAPNALGVGLRKLL